MLDQGGTGPSGDIDPEDERVHHSHQVLRDDSPLLGGRKTSKNGLTKEGDGRATLMSAIAILLNTVLGTGQLAMPHAFASGGLVLGSLTTLWCGFTAALGLYLLSRSATKGPHRNASFATLAAITFPKLGFLFDLAIFLKCFGVSISYLIIIGALMPRCIVAFSPSKYDVPEWLLNRQLWIMLSMTCLVPLAFLRRLDSLKGISYVALCTVGNLVFVVVYKYFDKTGLPERGPITLFDFSPKFVSSLPVQIFAFTCAQNIFGCYNELKGNTQRRLNVVIVSSIGGSAVIYQVLGVLGYLTFGAAVGSNIVEQYPHSVLVSICQLGIVILVLFSYPLQLHPCRASLDNLLRSNPKSPSASSLDPEVIVITDPEDIPLIHFVFETAFILLATFFIAIAVTKLETVLGFVGATGSTTISFILPSVFFLSLFRHSTDPFDRKVLIPAAAGLGIWGIVVMITTLSLKIYELVKPVEINPLYIASNS